MFASKIVRFPIFISQVLLCTFSIMFLLMTVFPHQLSNFAIVLLFGLFYGIGYGMFASISFGLAIDALPSRPGSRGRDLGILYSTLTIPQLVSTPIATNLVEILSLFNPLSLFFFFFALRSEKLSSPPPLPLCRSQVFQEYWLHLNFFDNDIFFYCRIACAAFFEE